MHYKTKKPGSCELPGFFSCIHKELLRKSYCKNFGMGLVGFSKMNKLNAPCKYCWYSIGMW